ncbi:MAG TPA: MBL fold metallo-hydrolase [Dongiaceae bacterium]|nr:MBL fold metallo-hydrolase [Dongiaceae bacterium]
MIDPSTTRRIPRTARVLVSHAHGDHTGGFRYKGLKQSTPQTRDIHRVLHDQRIGSFRALEINGQFVVDDIRVNALDAGHMLGSAQFLIQTPNTSILYTGDLNCIDTLTTKAAEPQQCDILVIEATYGSPHYCFPTRETVYAEIVEWALETIRQGRIPCLHVYAAGKAQEVVRLFNVYTHLPVVVNPRLDGVNETYHKSGVHLDWFSSDSRDGKTILDKDPCIYLTTPNDRGHIERRFSKAYATGWALSLNGRVTAFPLSSHADFGQLVSFVKACDPKQVYIFTGFAEDLRRALGSKLGLDARAVPSYLQRTLAEDY